MPGEFGLDRAIKTREDAKYKASDERLVTGYLEKLSGTKKTDASFMDWLEDGTVLCLAYNTIKPDSPLKYNKKANMPFAKMENISMFLKAIRSGVGMEESDCFTTPDLYDKKSKLNVINGLIMFSRAATVNGFKGPCIYQPKAGEQWNHPSSGARNPAESTGSAESDSERSSPEPPRLYGKPSEQRAAAAAQTSAETRPRGGSTHDQPYYEKKVMDVYEKLQSMDMGCPVTWLVSSFSDEGPPLMVLRASGSGGMDAMIQCMQERFNDQVSVGIFKVTGVDPEGAATSYRTKLLHCTHIGPDMPVLKRAKVSSYSGALREPFIGCSQYIETNNLEEDCSREVVEKLLRSSGGAHQPVRYDFHDA